MERIAVLLSGCGVYDGTEIHEAVLLELSLDRHGARAVYLAPGGIPTEEVDHTTGERAGEALPRDLLREAARLARGRIRTLEPGAYRDCRALIVPGGQGAVRHLLSGLLEPGIRRRARPEVAAMVRWFSDGRRPLGAIGLGQTILAAALGRDLPEAAGSRPASEAWQDADGGPWITPGYLTGTGIAEVAGGIDHLVAEVLRQVRAESQDHL